MVQVIWTEPALSALSDIAEYIDTQNPMAAKKLVATVFQKVERLELFPESRKKPAELKKLNYREVVVNPCRIFYKLENDTVYILHVMRQEQALRRYLFEGIAG